MPDIQNGSPLGLGDVLKEIERTIAEVRRGLFHLRKETPWFATTDNLTMMTGKERFLQEATEVVEQYITELREFANCFRDACATSTNPPGVPVPESADDEEPHLAERMKLPFDEGSD